MNLPKRLIRNSDSSHCSTAFCAVCNEHLYATWDETLQTWDCVHACRGHIAGVVNKDSEEEALKAARKESLDRVDKGHYWILVGHWEGSPFPIKRGEKAPPFSVWSVTEKEHWEQLRSEGYYTRRGTYRPVAKVDREFQKQTGKDVWEE